jgi:hypothetical protein
MGSWVGQQCGQQDDQKLVRFGIVCRGHFDPPRARLAACRSHTADPILKSALFVIVLAINEELETAPSDRVDLCRARQQDMASELTPGATGLTGRHDGDGEPMIRD